MVTGEFCDAPGPSILDFHTQEFASRVGRHVKIAIAAESDSVEPGTTALRRRKLEILREYVKRCGAGREFEDGGIRAVGDIYGALSVRRDVLQNACEPGSQQLCFA